MEDRNPQGQDYVTVSQLAAIENQVSQLRDMIEALREKLEGR